jgi:hypothetical protein
MANPKPRGKPDAKEEIERRMDELLRENMGEPRRKISAAQRFSRN